MLPLIEKTKTFKHISNCMHDFIKTNVEGKVLLPGTKHLEIIGCWMNDMTAGEYNPPHTHHDNTGWSTVIFLKVPKFINDARDPHKFKDGHLCFIMPNSTCHYEDPKVGDFYIFHAGHQHCVMPFKTKDPKAVRRSMSFNFIVNDKKQNV
jgi:hypothetical protein